jgi:hypothetical protein
VEWILAPRACAQQRDSEEQLIDGALANKLTKERRSALGENQRPA